MSKRVNLGTINADFVSTLSSYNVALSAITKAGEVRNAAIKKADAKEAEIKASRKKAMEEGMSQDEAISKYSFEEAVQMRADAKTAYDKAVEPHIKAKKSAYESVSDSLYYAYLLCMEKGTLKATGKLELKKGKSVEVHEITRTYSQEIANFLTDIGVDATNKTALEKFSEVMKTYTSGMIKSSKEGEYLKAKGQTVYKDLFLRAFLSYTVNKLGVLTRNEDNTITMTVYDSEEGQA